MTGVVLRCPNCGTTRATLGECEACHEAQVRYYCTNHAPGRWLDGRACPQCKAAFGDPPRPAPRPPPPPPIRKPAREAPPARPAAPAPTTPPRRAGRVEPEGETWGRGDRFPPHHEPEPEDVDFRGHPRDRRLVTWHDLLRAAMRARYARMEVPAPEPERRGLGLGGCLVRLVLMFFAFLAALYLFGGSLLQMFFFPF